MKHILTRKVHHRQEVTSIIVQLSDESVEKILHFKRAKSYKLQRQFVLDKVKTEGIGTLGIHSINGVNPIYCCVGKPVVKKSVIVRGTGPGSPLKMRGEIIAVNYETVGYKR